MWVRSLAVLICAGPVSGSMVSCFLCSFRSVWQRRLIGSWGFGECR